MKKDWNTVEVLRHVRHDWLNKLQLIKGNLALNKIDRAKEIINEIVNEAQQEAKLSNLEMTEFASLLLTHNWENHAFQLEYEVMDNMETPAVNDQLMTEWTRSFFSCLNNSIEAFHNNLLSVSIESGEKGTRFFFDFRGNITDKEKISAFLAEKNSSLHVEVQEFSDQVLSLVVFLPNT
ncbi:Spo0B C-terminal domain-containing protein [Bacillus methanolicus]|uniref:Sporulation initiation phosphotransferase B n=1 Tax=Bacillus methanolicus (strain MGA3 / ATCC 53907) TaxID=796606 RepID=I3ECX2_BACMM|nr:Spo0B C-terminal domain-containing protein [Bacillus methanolicus]AIE60890.1 sporulation initiation phosphotransferase B [Bacillus methanolicus MGA3]EIJ84343.1 sporulation initiation phosphotransferase B [Bacillus methanolicus MGA3]